MKKVLALMLSATMVLSLTACGNSSKKETEKTTEKKATEKVV